jgi:hypothetical protein
MPGLPSWSIVFCVSLIHFISYLSDSNIVRQTRSFEKIAMKNLYLFITGLLISTFGISQSCLPGGITFSTQAQIDSFQINYPGCTEIKGNIKILGDDIRNLNGLSVLTHAGGDIFIGDYWETNPLLASLSGLENLISIDSSLYICNNSILADLTGLNNLDSVKGSFILGWYVAGNPLLSNILALSNLKYVGGDIYFMLNNSLRNLSGLEGLHAINSGLYILDNESLNQLTGLENITKVGGDLEIYNSDLLKDFSGLENIDSIGGNLALDDDDLLSNITALNGVRYVGGNLGITSNDILPNLYGLEGISVVGGSLEVSGNVLLPNLRGLKRLTSVGGHVYFDYTGFTSLVGLNNLASIGGNVYIRNNALLTDFTGLDNLTSIWGNIEIEDNYALTSLSGMETLSFIGGGLLIKSNPLLTNMAGLDKLSLIGGNLEITYNIGLNSMTGLEKLNTIGGMLYIYYNYNLTTLSGLENVARGSVTDLTIRFNHILSVCAIRSICDYLADPNGTVVIMSNSTGCDNVQEVEAACGVGLTENENTGSCSLYPNPTDGIVHFTFRNSQYQWVSLKIYDIQGRIISTVIDESLQAGTHYVTWNTEDLPPGIYFYQISEIRNLQSETGKIVVIR